MQLRLLKRLLRLDTHRNAFTPDYQHHYPFGVVVDSHNPQHKPHPPTPMTPPSTLGKWWSSFGGEETPQLHKFSLMLMGHRQPGHFGLAGQRSNSYTELLRAGQTRQKRRFGSSRLRRRSHLKNPLPPLLGLAATHPVVRRRWRSSLLRKSLSDGQLLKRSETRRQSQQRDFGQQQQYNRWVREIFGQEGQQLLSVEGGRRRSHRHFMAQPRRGYQLHYSAYRPTPLWVYAAGLRPHLAPLAADRLWWGKLQRGRGQRSRPRRFWAGYTRASQRLLRRERWLQLRLERYPLELLRRRFERSLTMADNHLLVADAQRIREQGYPRFWNKWTPLRRYLGRHWRWLLRAFKQRDKLQDHPQLLEVQLGVDMRLLQLNLLTLQRRELLEPTRLELREWREKLFRRLLLPRRLGLGELTRELGRDLRLRVLERGLFGKLLEPLLEDPRLAQSSSAAGPPKLRPSQQRGPTGQRLTRKLARKLGLLRGLHRPGHRHQADPSGSTLLLPRPLRKGRRRLGFDDYLTETLGLSGGSRLRAGALGRARDASRSLLQRPADQEPVTVQPTQLELLGSGSYTAIEPSAAAANSWLQRRERQASNLQLAEAGYGRGYRSAERLRYGGGRRRSGGQQVALRGRRENLLSGYLAVETDLHPFRGWPVDYHREQCWDFWKLDQSLLPAATLRRLSLKLEDLPELLRHYLVGRRDYYTLEQLEERKGLRTERDLRDFEKRVVAELKKLCPPVDNQDRLEAWPIWQPGLAWWKPRYVAQASLFGGRPRRRCTHGTNRAARAPARLYQRIFIPRLLGALEGDYKMLRQLMPFTLHHPYSYRWRRLGRRWRRWGVSLERFMRWGPRYGRRVSRALPLGRRLKRRLQRRLFSRPSGKGGYENWDSLPSGEWRLRLRQLRAKRRRYRRRGHSITWLERSVTRVRTDARANLVTGAISHVRYSHSYMLRRRRVIGYRWHRKRGRRLELRLRRWRRCRAGRQTPGEALPELQPLRVGPLVETVNQRRGRHLGHRRRRMRRFVRLGKYRRRHRLLPRGSSRIRVRSRRRRRLVRMLRSWSSGLDKATCARLRQREQIRKARVEAKVRASEEARAKAKAKARDEARAETRARAKAQDPSSPIRGALEKPS